VPIAELINEIYSKYVQHSIRNLPFAKKHSIFFQTCMMCVSNVPCIESKSNTATSGYLISNFRHVLNAFFWVIPRRLNIICRCIGVPACEDGTECSETLAYKIQTPGNYPEESIQQHQFILTVQMSVCEQLV